MTKRNYKVKYPNRVNQVYSNINHKMVVMLNNGDKYILNAQALNYKLPSPNEDLDLSQHTKLD